MKLNITQNTSQLKNVFAISRGAKMEAKTVITQIEAAEHTGRGECVPYARYGETLGSVTAQIAKITPQVEAGLSRTELQSAMPAGAARCAIDCALWDLEAKTRGTPVWQLAGLPEPRRTQTAVTVSLDTPEKMAIAARETEGSLLKLKLGTDDDLARLEAVHQARPDAQLIVDGNEGLLPNAFERFAHRAASLGVVLIEQPFPTDQDEPLSQIRSPVPVCADESAHTAADIETLATRYQAVNVKLDKTGGLTGAIAMVRAARAANMGVMIGCMVAGSLSMAPASLLAGLADFTDLDGPLWLARDIENGLVYEAGHVSPPQPALWG